MPSEPMNHAVTASGHCCNEWHCTWNPQAPKRNHCICYQATYSLPGSPCQLRPLLEPKP
jgi:hypothetical protein